LLRSIQAVAYQIFFYEPSGHSANEVHVVIRYDVCLNTKEQKMKGAINSLQNAISEDEEVALSPRTIRWHTNTHTLYIYIYNNNNNNNNIII
jgi:hypothetical protein